MRTKLVIGTRGSRLALWQAEHIAARLREHYPELTITLQHMVTMGDKILDVPLAKIGGKGLFTKELEVAMLKGEIDLAVHSLKDVPTELPAGLVLTAITRREYPWDALISPVYRTLDALPQGAKVGTASLRRQAQLLCIRPDLHIYPLRGNLDTRLKKLDTEGLDAIVLAQAGLERLGLADRITQLLTAEQMLPAVGQGALALETRADDCQVREWLQVLDDGPTHTEALAERAFLAELEGGCQVPFGVFARAEKGQLRLDALLADPNGTELIRRQRSGSAAQAGFLGRELARSMYQEGGKAILERLFAHTEGE